MGAMKLYRAYNFRDKDPEIDRLRTIIQREHGGINKLNGKALAHVEKEGGPTVSCMRGWFFGATKRPQNATLEAAGRALGFRRTWVKHKPNGKAS
jgi:hypothetical protein